MMNPVNFKAQTAKIKQLNEIYRGSRKVQGTGRRQGYLAKAWRKVRRQHDDFVHKASAKLAKKYDTMVFEKLNINNMVKNHSLAQAIMDATWGKLREYTAYKVERRSGGGRCITVNPRVHRRNAQGAE